MGSNRPVCKLLSILRRPWGVRRINCSMKIIRIAAIFGSLNWRSCYPAVLRLNGSFCSKSSLQSSAVLRRRQIVDWTTRKKMRSSAFCRCLSFLYCFFRVPSAKAAYHPRSLPSWKDLAYEGIWCPRIQTLYYRYYPIKITV